MASPGGPAICRGPDDPRLHDIDATFRALLDLVGRTVTGMSRALRTRAFHGESVTASGELEVLGADGASSEPRVPHAFLRPGRRFGALARYSDAVPGDDIAPAVRGVTLRLFDGPPHPSDTGAVLDLTFNTGECFHAASAHEFVTLSHSGPECDALLSRHPDRRDRLWNNHRLALPCPEYDYYSQVPRGYLAPDGTVWAARFRLVAPDGPRDLGRSDPEGRWLPPAPPGRLPRPPGDTRPPAFFRDALRAQLATAPVTSLLQLQLHPLSGDPAADAAVFDATRSWRRAPWRNLARLRLTGVVPDDAVEPLRFNPALAPPDLGVALSVSPHRTTSVDHLRVLVYELGSAARLGMRTDGRRVALQAAARPSLPDDARDASPAPGPAGPAGPRTVCVVGAGPGGLAAARRLERLGHRVTVLESAPAVAGKCESVELDGAVHDLGAHLCTTAYTSVSRLADELGVATVDTTPYLVHGGGPGDGPPHPPPDDFFRPDVFGRYRRLRAERFPALAGPGLAHCAGALAAPVGQWLAEHRLTPMARSLGTGFTAAGYGALDDPDTPALLFAKFAEMTGLLSTTPQLRGHTGGFTPAGGFADLWRRVAAELRDVRTGVRIERTPGRVRVRCGDGTVVDADDLVLTVSPDRVRGSLDLSGEERELAGLVRYMPYRTLLCTITGLPRSGFYLLAGNIRSADPGRCVSFHHRHPGTDIYTCYAYEGPGGSGAERRLARDVERLGGRLVAVHEERSWPFMPHFGSAATAAGAYERLEALQGARGTYHVGGLPAFELVECVVAHAEETVDRHFPPAGATVPARTAGAVPVQRQAPVPVPALPDRTAPAPTPAAVRDWLATRLAAELGIPRDALDTAAPLDDHGLTSLTAAVVQSELSEWLGYRVPHTLLLHSPTLDAVADRLASHGRDAPDGGGPDATGPSLVLPLTPVRPLFLLGGIVGTPHYLRPLARALDRTHPCFGLRSPGLDGLEPPPVRIEDLADRYVAELRKVQPHGPYTLAGHSFGGLVAYEMALQLAHEGAEITRLVLLDTYVPVPGQRPPPSDETAAVRELSRMNAAVSGTPVPRIDTGLPPARQRELLAMALGATGSLPPEDHVTHLLTVYQANLEALTDYRISHTEVPVTLIRARGGFPSVMDPERAIRHPADPWNGWGAARLPGFEVLEAPGDHFTLLHEEHRHTLATLLTRALRSRDGGDAVPTTIPEPRR
ncbi:alpha/beta fold hydrolase [Streptomyces sp. NPDC093252]|uniref:alpha/beta fold hydrolase n=1 Tax=Streptomyces sp. NPDC093252 TaxID=3154980 RepID=UPI0034345081